MAIYTTLQNGSTGEAVRKLQNSLVSAGYNVGSTGADGIYGPATQRAVRQYQKDMGLQVDGIAGAQTLGKLYGTSGGETRKEEPIRPYDPMGDALYRQALEALEQVRQQKPVYEGSYDGQLQALYRQITERKPFSYQSAEDPLWNQYRALYTRQGQLAMEDAMGRSAMLTGGYGNSYAQAAGEQAYENYLQQLTQALPRFYSLAQNRYDSRGQALLDRYSTLESLAQLEFDRYREAVDQYLQDMSRKQEQLEKAYDRGYESWYDTNRLNLQKADAERDYLLALRKAGL